MDIQNLNLTLQNSPEVPQVFSSIRIKLFKTLHEIVFFGKGGYDFDTVYNLPIWLRNYIYHEMLEYYEKEAEEAQNTGHTSITDQPNLPEQVKQKIQATRKKADFSIKAGKK